MVFLAPLFMLLPMGLTVGLIALLIWWQSKERKRSASVWAAVAHQLGLEYSHQRITGHRHGQPVRVATVTRGSGKNKQTYTVISSRFSIPLDVGLSVRSHGFFEDLFRSGRDIEVGDALFDQRFLVQGDEDHRVRMLLTPELRRFMLEGLQTTSSFSLTDNGFTVECRGLSSYPAWLVWAIELATRASAQIELARPHIPGASPLGSLATSWAAYARARGLQGMHTPLCMWGTLDGIAVTAHAVRTARLTFGLNISLRFPAPVSAGLLVRPQQSLDGLSRLFGAQDHLLGDPAFDNAFVIRAPSAASAGALLDAPIRAALLQLQTSIGPVTLDDDKLSVRVPYVPPDPAAVPRLVHHLAGVADAIARKAQTTPPQVGPYR